MNQIESNINIESLQKEIFYKMSCSGGNGGQNVNKVATKATLYFPILNSELFSDEQKEKLIHRLESRITKDGFIVIASQETRSAEDNKQNSLNKLVELIQKGLQEKKIRRKVGIPASIKRERLLTKKQVSEKKEFRKKVELG